MSWFREMCEEMEVLYGARGWKRRLAEMLGVSDSNVQNWIRTGSAPPIVRTAYEAKQEVEELKRDLDDLQKDGFVIEELESTRGFRVLKLAPNSGRFIEVAMVRDIELARAIVQVESGALGEKISAVLAWAYDHHDHPNEQQQLDDLRDWRQLTLREEKAEFSQMLERISDD